MRPSQLDLFGDPPDVVEALRRVDRNRRRRGRRWELEYGLTDSDRCRAITLRRGCDICSRSDALVVDHDHFRSFYWRGSAVRGFLCRSCNLALGFFKDNIAALTAAGAHLRADGKYVVETLRAPRTYCRSSSRGGLSTTEYNLLVEKDRGACWTCGASSLSASLQVDHNHTTGVIRGLLCHNCNSGLGHLGDDPDRVDRAAEYLRLAHTSTGAREIGSMVRAFLQMPSPSGLAR